MGKQLKKAQVAMEFVFLIGLAVAAIIVGKMYINIMLDMRPVYVFSGLMATSSVLIFVFNQKKQYVKMLFSYVGNTYTHRH